VWARDEDPISGESFDDAVPALDFEQRNAVIHESFDAFVFGGHATYEFIARADDHLAALRRPANGCATTARHGDESFLPQEGERPPHCGSSDAVLPRELSFARQNGTRLAGTLLNRVSKVVRELLIERAVRKAIDHARILSRMAVGPQDL
jgi:hypothetical protein